MSELRHEAEELVAAMQVAEAASASLRRYGAHEQEAERRAGIRGMVRGSRALARALARFADCAAAHAEGVHCSPCMDAEVAALNEALGDFIFAAQQAAGAMRPSQATVRDVEIDVVNDRAPRREDALRTLHANSLPLRWPRSVEVTPPA